MCRVTVLLEQTHQRQSQDPPYQNDIPHTDKPTPSKKEIRPTRRNRYWPFIFQIDQGGNSKAP